MAAGAAAQVGISACKRASGLSYWRLLCPCAASPAQTTAVVRSPEAAAMAQQEPHEYWLRIAPTFFTRRQSTPCTVLRAGHALRTGVSASS